MSFISVFTISELLLQLAIYTDPRTTIALALSCRMCYKTLSDEFIRAAIAETKIKTCDDLQRLIERLPTEESITPFRKELLLSIWPSLANFATSEYPNAKRLWLHEAKKSGAIKPEMLAYVLLAANRDTYFWMANDESWRLAADDGVKASVICESLKLDRMMIENYIVSGVATTAIKEGENIDAIAKRFGIKDLAARMTLEAVAIGILKQSAMEAPDIDEFITKCGFKVPVAQASLQESRRRADEK